jgi:hypothetical protein
MWSGTDWATGCEQSVLVWSGTDWATGCEQSVLVWSGTDWATGREQSVLVATCGVKWHYRGSHGPVNSQIYFTVWLHRSDETGDHDQGSVRSHTDAVKYTEDLCYLTASVPWVYRERTVSVSQVLGDLNTASLRQSISYDRSS